MWMDVKARMTHSILYDHPLTSALISCFLEINIRHISYNGPHVYITVKLFNVISILVVRPDAGVSWPTVLCHSSSANHFGLVEHRVVHGCKASERLATS